MTPGDDDKLRRDAPAQSTGETGGAVEGDELDDLAGTEALPSAQAGADEEAEELSDDEAYEGEQHRTPPLVQLRSGPSREVPAVLIRFRVPGQCAPCDPGSLSLKPADRVIVDSEHGQNLGTVLRGVTPTMADRPLSRVLRLVDHDDLRIIERNRVREREAFQFCVERIKARALDMKLLAVELAHSGTRAVFYFSSADRIDFRALVKDLARRFHTRIEMRQIGVRDGARHTGGTGLCGRELCCATWLLSFKPISIRMAKDQNLALNHQKLSGLCGRLRCCLEYEEETYQSLRKGLPKIGKRVVTPQGEGRVKDVDVLQRKVRVQLMEGGYAQYDAADVTRPVDLQTPNEPPVPQSPPRPRETPCAATSPRSWTNDPRPPVRDSQAAPVPPLPSRGQQEPIPSGATPRPDNQLGPDGQPLRTGRRRRRRRGRRHRLGGQGPDGGANGPSSPPSTPSKPTG